MNRWIYPVLLAFLVSCSEQNTGRDSKDESGRVERIQVITGSPKYTIELEKVLSLSQLEEDHLASMWGIYEDEDQNLYWQDNRAFKVHQYSGNGDYLKSFGREGKGPGELTYLINSVAKGRHLFIADDVAMKVLVFDTDTGDYQSTINIGLNQHEGPLFWTFEILPESDSTFVVKPYGSFRNSSDSLGLFRYWRNGDFNAKSIFNYKRSEALEGASGNGRFVVPTPFTAKSDVKMRPNGGWVYADARVPEFLIYNADGELTKVLNLNIEAVALTSEHIQHEIDNANTISDLERTLRNAESVPDDWPLWDEFLISLSGNIWVEMNINPPFEREWWIISQEGELLSKYSQPEHSALRFVGENHLIMSRFPDGIMHVDRYRYEFQPVSESK